MNSIAYAVFVVVALGVLGVALAGLAYGVFQGFKDKKHGGVWVSLGICVLFVIFLARNLGH